MQGGALVKRIKGRGCTREMALIIAYVHGQADRQGASGLQEDLFSVSDATGYRV